VGVKFWLGYDWQRAAPELVCQLCHIWGGTPASVECLGCCSHGLSSCLKPLEQHAAAGVGLAVEVSEALVRSSAGAFANTVMQVNNVTWERFSAACGVQSRNNFGRRSVWMKTLQCSCRAPASPQADLGGAEI